MKNILQFPDTYFEDEVRDGFYVPGMMKKAWAAQMEILAVVDAVCRKYGIQYFADAGTLLGAVRHGGFIPWDDDLDISMKREDYNRFIRVAPEELPKELFLWNIHTDPEYGYLFSRIVNQREIVFSEEWLETRHGFPYVAGIDIFPLDDIIPDAEMEKSRCEVIRYMSYVAGHMDTFSHEELERHLELIERVIYKRLDRRGHLKNQVYLAMEEMFMMYNGHGATEIALIPEWVNNGNNKYKKEWYQESILIPFENTVIPAPLMYDAALREKYGEYMNIVKTGGCHDYPYYRMSEQSFQKQTGRIFEPKYQFLAQDLQREEWIFRKGNTVRREVVFLPYKASAWDSLESVWREAEADPDCDAYVIPIPYYYKNLDGNFQKMCYEGEKFPKDVPITWYEDYDFSQRRPDMIFIHNPYDEYNYVTSVHPFFYAGNLKQYTKCLVYIPYFVIDEIYQGDERSLKNMEYFVTVPGVVHADKVIVQSEHMRQTYIDCLSKFAGEDTRSIWEEKILGLGSPKDDQIVYARKKKPDVPVDWKKLVQNSDGNWKRVLLYHTSVSTLLQYGDGMLRKMEDVFRQFREQDEIVLLWRPDPLIKRTVPSVDPDLWERYGNLAERYQADGWGIYDDSTDWHMAFEVCDAYYGDPGSLMQLCKRYGKPVMMQDVKVS